MGRDQCGWKRGGSSSIAPAHVRSRYGFELPARNGNQVALPKKGWQLVRSQSPDPGWASHPTDAVSTSVTDPWRPSYVSFPLRAALRHFSMFHPRPLINHEERHCKHVCVYGSAYVCINFNTRLCMNFYVPPMFKTSSSAIISQYRGRFVNNGG
jgi:hypothetical protein